MNNLPCLLCGKTMEPTTGQGQSHIQPNDGIVCTSQGNYGSKIYDSFVDMDGKDLTLVFNICDDCLIVASDSGKIAEYRNDKFAKSKDPYPYIVPLHARLWVDSETHEEYNQKLKDHGIYEETVGMMDSINYDKDETDRRWQEYKMAQIAGKDDI